MGWPRMFGLEILQEELMLLMQLSLDGFRLIKAWPSPGHSYGGFKQSGIGREFSLEGMLDSFTQRKNISINLNTPSKEI